MRVSNARSSPLGSSVGVCWIALNSRTRFLNKRAQRLAAAGLDSVRVLLEVVEVVAKIEDPEVLFVLPRPEQVWAQPGAAADHLPELDLRIHRLKKHQIHHLRHVDAGVEHVHRDREVRCIVLDRKFINQTLRVFGEVIDDPRKVPRVLRIVVVETLLDELCVIVVAGKQDRLAQSVATLDFQPLLHQMFHT